MRIRGLKEKDKQTAQLLTAKDQDILKLTMETADFRLALPARDILGTDLEDITLVLERLAMAAHKANVNREMVEDEDEDGRSALKGAQKRKRVAPKEKDKKNEAGESEHVMHWKHIC
jgi:hypothetical protein